jgi:hypothetical protein
MRVVIRLVDIYVLLKSHYILLIDQFILNFNILIVIRLDRI